MLSTWEVSKEHIMGLNLRQHLGTMSKGVVYTPMRGYMMFPSAPVEGKYFANPNFVNGNNPSLLGRKDFYRTAKETKEELVTTTEVQQKQQQQQEVNKRRRKRGRRNRRKNKQTAITTTNKKESRVPQLTESFRNISVRQEIQKEAVKEASRTRVPSLSESEDSFIVFDDQGAEDEESAIESDPELAVEESTEVSETDGASSDSCIPQKKVRFADDKNLCEVHPMVQWSYAYQAARKGPWEMHARDRARFWNRIKETEKTLRKVLSPIHREKVYRERFEPEID